MDNASLYRITKPCVARWDGKPDKPTSSSMMMSLGSGFTAFWEEATPATLDTDDTEGDRVSLAMSFSERRTTTAIAFTG